jgi:hypothetical protein
VRQEIFAYASVEKTFQNTAISFVFLFEKYGGVDRIKDTFGSLSSSMLGNNQRPLKYYCMGCGKERRETTWSIVAPK